MTTEKKLQSLIQQVGDLPDEAQAELFQSLVQMRSQHLGIDIADQETDALSAR